MPKIVCFCSILLLFVSCAHHPEPIKENTGASAPFNELCLIIEEALSKHPEGESQSQYIASNIEARVNSSDVSEAYSSLAYIPQENRYAVFKAAAEEVLTQAWSCEAMHVLFSQ